MRFTWLVVFFLQCYNLQCTGIPKSTCGCLVGCCWTKLKYKATSSWAHCSKLGFCEKHTSELHFNSNTVWRICFVIYWNTNHFSEILHLYFEALSCLLVVQGIPYNFELIPSLSESLENLDFLSDDALAKISLECEPHCWQSSKIWQFTTVTLLSTSNLSLSLGVAVRL